MAEGLKSFRRGQIGVEAIPGTAVAATRPLHYTTLEIAGEYMVFSEPEEELNTLALVNRSTPISMDPIDLSLDGELTFEDFVFWMQGLLKGGVAPTQPDPAADLYTFSPSFSALNAQKTFTIEGGDNTQEVEVPYCVVQEVELGFARGEICSCAVSLLGQRIVESTFTGALTIPTVESAIGQKVELYMDSSWAGIGGTQVMDAALLEGSVTLRSGLVLVQRASGNLYFTKHIENPRRIISAELTVEHDSNSKAWRALYEANTKKYLELRFVGSNITGLFDRFIKVQWSGPFRMFEVNDQDGGVMLAKVRSESEYDATGGAEAKVLVQTALNAVTEF